MAGLGCCYVTQFPVRGEWGGGVSLPPQAESGRTVPMKNRIDVEFFAVASVGIVAKKKLIDCIRKASHRKKNGDGERRA